MRKDTDIKRIWFTADLHFMHPKIVEIGQRPTTIKKHDKWLINQINKNVGKKDELYILGDVAMASRKDTEKILDKINGNKHLILGNHDNSIRNSTRFEHISQIRNFNFSSPSYPNVHIVLCHYPIASWERKVHGSIHLFGHVHGRFSNSGLSFDVGIDSPWTNYEPISLERVLTLAEEMKNVYKKLDDYEENM